MSVLEPAAVRSWAKTAKIPTPERGRLPRATVAAYLKAHPAVTRELAEGFDVEVSSRGPVSLAVCESLALAL
jgi:hypothetical protein